MTIAQLYSCRKLTGFGFRSLLEKRETSYSPLVKQGSMQCSSPRTTCWGQSVDGRPSRPLTGEWYGSSLPDSVGTTAFVKSIYHHIQRYATSVALELVFGTHCPTHDDPIIKEYLYVNKETEYLTKPGEHPPIDVFTFLRYVPERWASWKGACKRVRNMQRKFFLGLMDRCLARVRDDKRNGSFMEDLLDNEKEYGFDRENLL